MSVRLRAPVSLASMGGVLATELEATENCEAIGVENGDDNDEEALE